mgnify:CR=1 FL=1
MYEGVFQRYGREEDAPGRRRRADGTVGGKKNRGYERENAGPALMNGPVRQWGKVKNQMYILPGGGASSFYSTNPTAKPVEPTNGPMIPPGCAPKMMAADSGESVERSVTGQSPPFSAYRSLE